VLQSVLYRSFGSRNQIAPELDELPAMELA